MQLTLICSALFLIHNLKIFQEINNSNFILLSNLYDIKKKSLMFGLLLHKYNCTNLLS